MEMIKIIINFGGELSCINKKEQTPFALSLAIGNVPIMLLM
jgi:hypothetical protein